MTTIDAETHAQIRAETPSDAPAIFTVTQAAFAEAEHRSGTEGAIIEALRQAGALTVSLVADADGMVIGHIAFSPITVNGRDEGWFGLGPVSVDPARQGSGLGSRLVSEGLTKLKAKGAKGCVVLGDPRFYGRFGFAPDPKLRYDGVPPEYFMAQAFEFPMPEGLVAYHQAFEAS
jgi:putative acetyltransferase